MLTYARMRPTRAPEGALVVVAAAALTIAFTWPITPRLAQVGRIDSGDGQYSIWNVAWVARALVRDPLHVFDANIFHPAKGTLAYSEPNILAGVLAVPAWLLTGSALAAHNSVLLLAFTLSVLSTYALARHLSGRRDAAWFAAIAYSFCPYAMAHLTHIQLLMTFGPPLALLCLHQLVERVSPARAAALGLALFAAGIGCGYYGILTGLAVGVGAMYYAVTRGLWREPRYWGTLFAAVALAGALLLPFILPFVALQDVAGYQRPLEASAPWSASWTSWLASGAWAHRWWLRWLEPWGEVLFPGWLPLGLGLTGMVLAGIRPAATASLSSSAPPLRETARFYALLGALALWSSFGPRAGLYAALYHIVPFFSLLRAPSRFGLLTVLALAVLSALAVAIVTRRRGGGMLLAALVAAELFAAPIRWPTVGPPGPALRLLAQLPPAPVAEFPFFAARADWWRHTRYMLTSTWHWRPIVNGYSDYAPPGFWAMAETLRQFPSDDGLAVLDARGVRYVVFTLRFYDAGEHGALVERIARHRDRLRPLVQSDGVWLFEIVR
jgi:hypothetical protein